MSRKKSEKIVNIYKNSYMRIFLKEEFKPFKPYGITREELKRLYIQKTNGISNEKEIDTLISKFIVKLKELIYEAKELIKYKSYWYAKQEETLKRDIKTEKELLNIIQLAKTPEEKITAIDRTINSISTWGILGKLLVEDYDSDRDCNFFFELSILKPPKQLILI